ncbi:hypothetical protein AAT19DRAFT_14583 [Rhodotorula toruloides]|uniref:Uncharacterized protein n=1 Tax=Rhodotorula toruloides TaxID=5286 RepID=A0A2T0A896_RHOTO|nr:hypothetical protein AAT19DRAFT_14583 [Rhodotorula toruloides]
MHCEIGGSVLSVAKALGTLHATSEAIRARKQQDSPHGGRYDAAHRFAARSEDLAVVLTISECRSTKQNGGQASKSAQAVLLLLPQRHSSPSRLRRPLRPSDHITEHAVHPSGSPAAHQSTRSTCDARGRKAGRARPQGAVQRVERLSRVSSAGRERDECSQ